MGVYDRKVGLSGKEKCGVHSGWVLQISNLVKHKC